jgi:glucose-6-phosphate isomerase
MGNIKLDYSKTLSFIREDDIFAFQAEIEQHIKSLYNKTGKGNDFLGWVNLPSSISFDDIKKIENTASFFKKSCDIVIIIGIGGSYLGAKAVVDAFQKNK